MATRYQFTGREYDPAIGLYYYRARMYDPTLGRFTSEDPIGFSGGDINLYGYVSNNPLNSIDPYGLQDGPVNYLRNPLPYQYVGLNAAANTVSDLLGLDYVAEWSWTAGDYRCSTNDRLTAGAKLGGWSAFQAVGGYVIGRALGWVGGRFAPYLGRAKFPSTPPAKTPPNPWGKLGSPQHQAAVGEVAEDLATRGLTPIKEYRIQTPNGSKSKRFADVVGVDANGTVVEIHQVGRITKRGIPVSRERNTLQDIFNATSIDVIFHSF